MKYLMKYSLKVFVIFAIVAVPNVSFAKGKMLQKSDSNGLIYGYIWNDKNNSGERDAGEKGIKGVVVYLDNNDNGVLDADEPSMLTSTAGYYRFRDLPPGEYNVRQEVPFGWRNVNGGEGDDVSPTIIVNDNITPKIIGGDETREGEYPFMVAVGSLTSQGFAQFCGGALITDRWVATAAHCSVGANPSNVGILAGTNRVDDGSGQLLTVKQVYLHPEYVSVAAGYDIALWELETPVALEQSGLQSVAMLSPQNQQLAEAGVLATTVGWGTSNLDSNLLQDVHLPIFDEQACADIYSTSINFDTQICGAAVEGGIDACQGDSGGPLIVRDSKAKRWHLAGITSYGNGCALPGFPGVWARVSALSDWAKSVAIEPSRVNRVTVSAGNSSLAIFGNSRTQFEKRKKIIPRWQLVNSEVSNDPATGLTFNWRIIDESTTRVRTFECGADSDGAGPVSPSVLDCMAGTNQTTLPPLEDGVFLPMLTASEGETNFSRESSLIIGTPTETSVSGDLEATDDTDPDFPFAPFYIDYFDLSALSNEKAVAIRIESTDFNVFAGLYDRDLREANGAGGILSFFTAPALGVPAEIIFFPDPNVNYLIGVSSFGIEAVGSYTVTIVNDGEAEPTTLSLPAGIANRAFRKLPDSKIVVPAPYQQ